MPYLTTVTFLLHPIFPKMHSHVFCASSISRAQRSTEDDFSSTRSREGKKCAVLGCNGQAWDKTADAYIKSGRCMMLEFLCSLMCRLFFFTGAVRDEGSYPKPLSAKEEARCLALAGQGDKNARDKLIRHNMRLVAHVVKKYAGAAETDDMISVGSIGLIKAINTYSPARGTRLATYTARCIENEVLMFIRAGKKHKANVSLSDPVGTDKDGNELTLMDLLFEKEDKVFGSVEQSLMQEKFLAAVRRLLNERETAIICMRYALTGGVPLPQREVARRLKISRSYVSRIEKHALEKLRAGLRREDFFAD